MSLTANCAARVYTHVEWPTLGLCAATYLSWALVTIIAQPLGPWASIPLLALILAQHSSLQHEMLHGHPFRDQRLNDALVFPALGLLVPYERFRQMHLAHHFDPALTDPYDDPESNFLDPAVWAGMSRLRRLVYAGNNTLLGRMLLGPPLGMARLWREDLAAIRAGDHARLRAWGLHAVAIVPVALWLGMLGTVPMWAYLAACWLALSLLRIRTFLEHRADARAAGRSVIIEDRGPLSILFLNNNFHAVHHAHPNLPWYRLPEEYARRRDEFLRRNGGYRFGSYAEVFRTYLLRRKDPVAHPIWTASDAAVASPPPGR